MDERPRWHGRITCSNPANAWLLPQKHPVPVLHYEFEGSRIKDVLDATNAFGPSKKWCKKSWFTKLVCKVIQVLASPIILLRS